MKERPILFSGQMVKAILDGRKMQTRRVMKDKRIEFRGPGGRDGGYWSDPSCWGFEDEDGIQYALAAGVGVDEVIPCPYGASGDRLWVREPWRTFRCFDDLRPAEMLHSTSIQYEVDYATRKWPKEPTSPLGRYRHARFMPRWAARITLELTGVRVERVQEISADDAIAEGIKEVDCPSHRRWVPQRIFSLLWDEINDRRGYGWDVNPWVWVLNFRRVT